jgi:hypothetical protein
MGVDAILSQEELNEMQESTIKTLRRLCHNVVEVISFEAVEVDKDHFNCVLDGIVGSLRKRKIYRFDLKPHKRVNEKIIYCISNTTIENK